MVKCEIAASLSLDILTIPWAFNKAGTCHRAPLFERFDEGTRRCNQIVLKSWLYDHTVRLALDVVCFSGEAEQYTASKDYLPVIRFQHLIRKVLPIPPKRSSLDKHLNGRPDPTNEAESTCYPRVVDESVLVVSGIELGTITDVSMRMAGGIVSRDCLEMAGMSFSEGCEALRNKPAKVWERLWRILVADRNNEGLAAPTSFGLAFFKIFKQILRLRCIDTEEMLKTTTDQNTLEFLTRVRDVVRDRRMFSSGVNHYDEALIGLAPRESQLGDRIIVAFGGSVPLLIRRVEDLGQDYWKLIGEMYLHGKMHGEAFIGMSNEVVAGRTRQFQLIGEKLTGLESP